MEGRLSTPPAALSTTGVASGGFVLSWFRMSCRPMIDLVLACIFGLCPAGFRRRIRRRDRYGFRHPPLTQHQNQRLNSAHYGDWVMKYPQGEAATLSRSSPPGADSGRSPAQSPGCSAHPSASRRSAGSGPKPSSAEPAPPAGSAAAALGNPAGAGQPAGRRTG